MYDLSIIGAGWAGFTASLEAKELGLKVCLIEKKELGGTCLNRGCIPTKSLIQSAKTYNLIKKSSVFGIDAPEARLDFLKIQERKENLVLKLRQGMQSMLGGVDFFNDEASFISHEEIKVGAKNIKTKSVLIATGSQPAELSVLKFDSKKVISSDQLLNLKEIPESLLIVGGGVIGCEFASLFVSLGSKVSIVEKMPQLLPTEDHEISKKIESIFRKKGIKVNTNTDVSAINLNDYTLILVCVGRSIVLSGLNLETAGIKSDKKGVPVDEYLRTNVNNVYAAGDCTGKVMLAHFAAYQGEIAASNCANPENLKKADNQNIPSCIFTDPEISSVGLSEKEAINKGLDVEVDRFDFLGSGMAHILQETDGFVKIVSDKKTKELLGASLIGPRATELISVLTLAVSNRLKTDDIRNTVFAHPTLSEAIYETLK